MKKKREALIIFSSAFLIIAIAPVVGFATSYVTLLDRTENPIPIQESSSSGIQEAYAYPFTLTGRQKVDIQFSMSLPNSTTTLKILDEQIYEINYILNRSPIEINGEEFLNLQGAYLRDYYPSNYVTIYEQGSRYIRFSGGIYDSDIVYRPGNYVILVYGSQEKELDEINSSLFFNLLIKLDGPGNFIELLLITLSLLTLISYCLIITINYLRKIELPYKKKIKKDKIFLIQG